MTLDIATVRCFRAERPREYLIVRSLRPGDVLFENTIVLFEVEQEGIAGLGAAQIPVQCDGLADAAAAGLGLTLTFRYQRPRASSLIEPVPNCKGRAVSGCADAAANWSTM